MDEELARRAIYVMIEAFHELNTIRARDGVPYTHNGWKSSVSPQYFSSIVDELNAVVSLATGHSAHCHPQLYRFMRESVDASIDKMIDDFAVKGTGKKEDEIHLSPDESERVRNLPVQEFPPRRT